MFAISPVPTAHYFTATQKARLTYYPDRFEIRAEFPISSSRIAQINEHGTLIIMAHQGVIEGRPDSFQLGGSSAEVARNLLELPGLSDTDRKALEAIAWL